MLSFLRVHCPAGLGVACSLALLVLWPVFALPTRAAEKRPVLVVPAAKDFLELAVRLPKEVRVDPSAPCRLVETGQADAAVPAQIVPAIAADGTPAEGACQVVARIPPRGGTDAQRRFVLEQGQAKAGAKKAGQFRLKDINDKSLGLWDGKQPVLVYNFGLITSEKVPATDHRRSRADYIHPVYGIRGEVITDDFPKDHYHHHGIFWTWPHIMIDGKEHDLWAGDTIRQQFGRWLSRQAGPVTAVIGVENGWFVGDEKVMIERVWIRPFKAADGSRSLDISLTFIPVGKPVALIGAPKKSYGGLTMRFSTPSLKSPDTVITVPSGVAKEDLPETRLPWADLTSKLGAREDLSGAAVFIPADHPDFPPTWLTRHYGCLCVGYPGVVGKTFEPGVPIRLEYRVWIHKDQPETAALQQAYDSYRAARLAKWQ